ncbi:MAG: helix-turn-helix transcriptional regulator [Gammaproteobacteria bacterium]|nr:helix-turn-helix transcriptional regulator [Gammaproteobacteria bacterium]
MKEFDNSLIIRRRVEQNLTYRALSLKTLEVDEASQGISPMTCMRMERENSDPSIKSLILICAALGISPTSTFREKK